MPAANGGPGGLGGAASADFDSLIDLIVSTVEHESWMENGTGEGEIQPFPTNLSLVVSQTQRVHEQIADLLEQLRRLQDLQVTIEVRFIRLTDSFFERIGVDFDFNVRNRSGFFNGSYIDPPTPANPTPQRVFNNTPSNTVGLNVGDVGQGLANTNFTADLDLPFRQGSFGLSTPQFGTPVDVGTFGFAILSDIEAFFMINASQGDRRANVLQAPKVTLFNGQQAQVVDAAFRPFVISVIPVVGEFAAAQQPVIVVLSEGTMLSVQAVVSDDRRYVRLTLVPFFSQIGEVQEFTFEGSETTSTSESETDDDDDGNDESNEEAEEITRSGTTVQLPTFEVISVATTVSVPDGGTVLMGGIKRLVEGRNEFGVPLLSKVPYVDRLFRNVGIGRETDSLMMMVTPHIIIQEEEEDRLGVETE
jgi:general secretion pathway protein D